mmetsp:Transcript_8338/g.14764  ORF Transcript_8338/g.14764 Transcript_8338/m.14764 type:complete len:91 (+) Transcript_8338:1088-1360(+)
MHSMDHVLGPELSTASANSKPEEVQPSQLIFFHRSRNMGHFLTIGIRTPKDNHNNERIEATLSCPAVQALVQPHASLLERSTSLSSGVPS